MKKFNVPIYNANLTFEIKEKTGKISNTIRKRKICDVIVKGFSIVDIINRKKDIYEKKLNLKETETLNNIEVELISQHGYGVDD